MTNQAVEDVIAKVSQAAFGKPLVTNVLRGQVVEAIVALALEPLWTWCAADYASWDFIRADGTKLEVKQSAVLQSWGNSTPSKPKFDIAERTGYWTSSTNWVSEPGRAASIYVFAYHDIFSNDADHRDPLQWQFYVIPAALLGNGKTITLGRVQALTEPVQFSGLLEKVESIAIPTANI